MEQSNIIKLSSRKPKEYLYKYNNFNNHKKTKTESNLYEDNSKFKKNMNLKSLRIKNPKISLIPENNSQKNIKKINSVRPVTSTSYSRMDFFTKVKNSNNKNNLDNNMQYKQPLSLQSNNINYSYFQTKNRNTFAYGEKELTIKKNKSNTSLSYNQKLKKSNSLEFPKTNNINEKNHKNNIVKIISNTKREYLDLNKIIKKDKKIILNKLNPSKSTSNFLQQYNKDQKLTKKINRNNDFNSYSSKYNDYIFDNSDLKNSINSLCSGTMNNIISISENNNNIHKFNSFNSHISPTTVLEKKSNKKASVFGQYYIDIDLSLNNNIRKTKNSLINKRLLKKSVNLDASIQKDFKIKNNISNKNYINTNIDINSNLYKYKSPNEKNKKSNSKNIIDLRNNYNSNFLNKKANLTSREKIPIFLNTQNNITNNNNNNHNSNNNFNKNKTTKNRLIPISSNKIHSNNYINNNCLVSHTNNNSKKRLNYNLVGSKLKKNNLSKKELFYTNDSKMWKDYINFQKKVKSISHTPKNRTDDFEINFNTEQIPANYINLNSNYLTDNRLKKNNRTENYEFSYLSTNNNKNMNKKNILNQQQDIFSKNENYLDDFNSIDNTELKISVLSTNRKYNHENNIKKYGINKDINISEYNNTQESASNNDTKSKKGRNNDYSNIKDANLVDSVSNLENNCFNYNINNLNNFVNKSARNNNNNNNNNNNKYNGVQIIVSNTDSGKKKISISPPNNKLNVYQYNGNLNNNKKNNKININIDEYNSKIYLNNNNKQIQNKTGNKMINYTEYNKELLNNYNKNLNNIKNNNKKESYTLLKSISFCKKINNPVKLYPKKKEAKINKAFYIPSYVKRIYIPNQNNNNNKNKKFNNTVEIKQNNRINNNSISNYYKKYKNNIININNNTSNVNVLNVKNSSINICFEKKEKYKDLSPEKNINYSTTVSNIHRNNKINIKNDKSTQIEKNEKTLKNNNKLKIGINDDNIPTYIKISAQSNKHSHLNTKRNDNKFTGNGKKGNVKNNTQQLSMNNSEMNILKHIKPNKVLSERENKIKINLNDFKNNVIDSNLNIISLNSARNENTFNSENNEKTKIMQVKEKNYKKINLPTLTVNNSIIVLNKKVSYGVYVKPTCISSRSRSKSKNNKSQSEISSRLDYINPNIANITYSKNPKLSRSLNVDKNVYTSPYKNAFQNKISWSLKLSNSKMKSSKSARSLYQNSIQKKNFNKKIKKQLEFYSFNRNSKKVCKIRNISRKNCCFIYKFCKYFLRPPKINKCCFIKKYINKNINKKLDQEKSIKIKDIDIINKKNNDVENNENNNENKNINNDDNKLVNLSIEKYNKGELINDENNTKLGNNKLNNEEDKINESSQNGLIMTFGEVNYAKRNSEKYTNNTNYKNDIPTEFNNDIINDESDLDIYKKLNIIQQEPEMKNDYNISENEDVKLYFSDEDEISMGDKEQNPLCNSNKINNNELCLFYESTNGKEIEDIKKKVCKTFKKTNKGNKYNLENAEKGLRILKKIVVRRGYKSDDEQIKTNINVKTEDHSQKIYLGTNKLNELFNNRKENENSYNKKNNSYNIKYRNKYSKSVTKDILKGITKIENFFERKYFNDNTKINTYEGKNNFNRDEDFSDENSCNIDNSIDYDDDIKPKIRTYIQKTKNLYFSSAKVIHDLKNRVDIINDDDFINLMEANNKNFKNNEDNENSEYKNKENNCYKELYNENKYIKNNDNENNNEKDIENSNISLKENLLKEFNKEMKLDKINNIETCKTYNNIMITNLINQKINNNEQDNKDINKDKNENILEIINFLKNIKEYQSNNIIKHDMIYLLNIITEENYSDMLNKITDIILYKNNNINDNEVILKNEHIFKDIIFNKSLMEKIYVYLYAKLCYDLNNNISNSLIEQKNIKNNKERNLKFIINEESITYLNKFKNISKEYNYITDKESDEYILLRQNIIGYVIFIYELINLEILKQQFGFNILEQFYKKYMDNEVGGIFRDLYLEACVVLLNKLGKNIFETNNTKLMQNLNNYINNNLLILINQNDNKINKTPIPSHIKYKIINIIKKNENSWKESLFELSQKDKNKIIFEENEIKEKKEEIKPNNKINNFNNKDIRKEENVKIENKSYIIEEDLINYISYFTEQGNKGQINIKENVDKSYNWKAIDDLINEKNFGLEYIINQFIKICSNIIHDENQLVIANDYIKNIIEYYSNNLPKNILDSIHNEMIKTFLNVDEFIKVNYYMSKILGNLLFILIENRLYHIKDFNNYLKAEKQTQINLAIITKYCIISAGKFAKKYFNDFKQTKLFFNNNIFNQYVSDALKDLFYFIK